MMCFGEALLTSKAWYGAAGRSTALEDRQARDCGRELRAAAVAQEVQGVHITTIIIGIVTCCCSFLYDNYCYDPFSCCYS